jgi:ribosome-associated protein
MATENLKYRNFEKEFILSSSRSAGPGGQNVNKVNTRIELRFNISNSSLLDQEEKRLITEKLKNRINSEGVLILSSQSERSQAANRKKVIEKFYELVLRSLTIAPERKSTRPTLKSKSERVKEKRSRGLIKKLRTDKGETDLF